MILKLSLLRWCATLIGVQLLAALLWVLGPLLPALEPWTIRLVLVLVLLIGWAVGNFLLDWRRTQREAGLAAAVTRAAEDEAAALGAKLATALTLMRRASGKRAYLYEQPWYAIIGPPGAGKTTALLNAGLTFPLANELGPGAVAGVGGTRSCEWWFTKDAVLIDTAGRYTTQDSNQEIDRAGWETFLSLLRKARPREPLNGILVAIPLLDIATGGAAAAAHATAIRSRIDELTTRLGRRIPVYLLLTKADLLIGFSQFFDDLDRTGREQVWGTTFPLAQLAERPSDLGTALGTALDTLRERLERRLFPRLDAEANPERRVLIAGFPAQFATVLAPIEAFVAAAFGRDPSGKTPLLRGVYLTSGTQEGTPIDRLIGGLGRAFGIDQRRAAPLRPEAGRSYFLAALLRDVIFREAMLVSHPPGWERRRRVTRIAGFAACGIAAIAGAGVIWAAQRAPAASINAGGERIAALREAAAALPLDPVKDADFARLLPFLDAAMPRAASGGGQDTLGLSQSDKIVAAEQAQYRHALDFALLPRLVWRAEERMRGLLGEPDTLYEATRIDLMLGSAGPLDRALVADWFARDWAARDWAVTLPGAQNATARAALANHLAALLAEPLPAIPLDGPLIAEARRRIARVPLAERAYSRLKPLAAAAHLAPWKPAEALGPAGVPLFLRLSGRSLDEAVPGLYTRAGLRQMVLPAIAGLARQAAEENWVLGEATAADEAQRRSLDDEILRLYAADYIAAWDALLADLDPAPMRNLTRAAQDLFILASAHSPIRNLLSAVAEQTSPSPALGAGETAVARIDQHFAALHALFAGSGSSLDQSLRLLSDLQQQLAKQAASTTAKPAGITAGEDPAVALRAEALRQPAPLGRWLTTFATAGQALRDGGPRGAMIAAWNAGGGPATLCPAVIANRYPFVAAAGADSGFEDFARLFAPGGAIDAFFNAQLKPYVDLSGKSWRLHQVDGVDAPVAATDLAQFQRAAAIRDLYFPNGSTQPLVRADIVAVPPAGTATLELGALAITAQRGMPARSTAVVWPGRPAVTSARLTVLAAAGDPAPLRLQAEGPWALFHLIAQGKLANSGDRSVVTFGADEHQARFELRANPNPFASTLLAEFRCPAVQ